MATGLSSPILPAQPRRTLIRRARRTDGWRTLKAIGWSFLLYLGLNLALNRATEANGSFILACLFGAAALWPFRRAAAGRVLGKISFVVILLFVYWSKIAVGVAHFLTFVAPHYFSGSVTVDYLGEFTWLEQATADVAATWHREGLFRHLPVGFWIGNKNAALLTFMSLNYYVTGPFPLNITVWNVLFGIYSALLVTEVAIAEGAPRRQALLVLGVALLIPFNLISSGMWRDTTGQFCVVLGAYILYRSRHALRYWLVLVPLAGLLALMEREPYIFVFFLAAAIYVVNQLRMRRNTIASVWLKLFIVAGSAGALLSVFTVAFSRFGGDALGIDWPDRIKRVPFRFLRGLAGPFPWTQYFLHPNGYAFQPADYLESVLNLALLVCAVPLAWNLYRTQRKIDLLVLIGLLLMFAGVMAVGVHSGYVSIGLILLLPLASRVGSRTFLSVLVGSLGVFVAANVLYTVAGLRGSGLFQGLSGGY